MNVVYSSQHYHVVEFPGQGYEVIRKRAAVGVYLYGDAAMRFGEHLAEVIADDASQEAVDEFLEDLDELMMQRAIYH
ncbi:MAG: DUF3567 family protein [Burkholderiales bacterium]|nr:DUF3567 family protein [Burkholderiales bacterium]